MESCDKEDLGHIATEFQVSRGEDSKGRVDLIFNYRSVSYLVELKVGWIAASCGNIIKVTKRTQEPWINAIKQLNELDTNSVSKLLKSKTVKLPIVIYFYYSMTELEKDINNYTVHKKILDIISKDEESIPDFEIYSEIPRTATRSRTSELTDSENRYLYGFSIFSKQK